MKKQPKPASKTKPAIKPAVKKTATKTATKKTTAAASPAPAPAAAPNPPPPSPSPPPPEQNIETPKTVENDGQPKPAENLEEPQHPIEKQIAQEKSFPTIQFNPSSISSFYDLENYELEEYNLVGVPFLTFEGISNLKNAKTIFIKNALFTSFKQTTKLPNLKKCSFSGSPIYFRENYRIMTLLAFGEQIEEIDEIPVSIQEKRIFSHFNQESLQLLIEYVQNGGIIMQNIDEKLIKEIKIKMYAPPQIDLPIKSEPLSHIYFTPFLNEGKLHQFLNKEISKQNLKESKEIKEEKEQRNLISKIESEVFDNQNRNKLPTQFEFNEIFEKKEIENAIENSFNIIKESLNEIKKKLQESIQQIKSFNNNNYTQYIYSPIINVLNELDQKTNTILSNLSSRGCSLTSIIKNVDDYYKILNRKGIFSTILNFLQDNYHNIIHLTSTFLMYQLPKEIMEIDEPQIQSILKSDNERNIPKLIETINCLENNEKKKILIENNVIQQLQNQLKAKLISEEVLKNLKKASIYITLIQKCPTPRYFLSFASECQRSFELSEQIPDLPNNPNKQQILQLFSEIKNFANVVANDYNQIIKVNQLIPKYADIKLSINEAIGKAKIQIREFEIEKINILKEKVHKYWEEGNEFQKKRDEVTSKVEKVLKFIHEAYEYQDKNEIPFLFKDLSSFGEEFVQSKDPAKRQQIQEELKKLNDESDAKDKELQELLAQCAELGIDV